MTTPADSTPASIIHDAMIDAGLLQEGQNPNSEKYANYMRRLRDIINFQQTQGIKLFLMSDQSITVVEGQDTYTLFPGGSVDMTKPLRVDQAYWLSAQNVRRALSIISWNEFLLLGQTATEGSMNSIFVNKLYNQLSIRTWPVPNASDALGTLHVLLRLQASTQIELDETIQFPPEWRMFLHWALAAEICTGQPESVIARCEGKYSIYKEALEGWDVEDTPVQFQVDTSRGNSPQFV